MNVDEKIQLGLKNHQSGNLLQAENIYKEILRDQPNNFYALNYLGILYYQFRNYDSAIEYIKKALQLNPSAADAYYNLGNIYKDSGQLDEAINCFQKALELNPDNADAYNNEGIIYKDKRRLDEAITCFQKAIQLNPNHVIAHYNLGIIFKEKKQIDEAINCFQKALKLNPNIFAAYYNLGIIFQEKKQLDDAIAYYHEALKLNPNLADLYFNLGTASQEKLKIDDAIFYYQKALKMNPNLLDAYCNLGTAFQEKGQIDDAIAYYRKAIQLNPALPDAYYNLGNALQDKMQFDYAITCYQKAIQLNPDFAEAYSRLVYQFRKTCAWQELKAMTAKLDGLTKKALDTGTKTAESPFLSIIRHADPFLNFAIAKSWSRDIARTMSNLKIRFSFDGRRKAKTKIIIGYLSNDFRNHATAHLMCSLFGLHNRDEFKIFCYSYGKDDGSYYRTQIQHDCDEFVDISSLSYDAAARCIYEDQIDILVDLKGYTQGNRIAICALRPAPVQVCYLGFPGTTGADFFDYIITDKIVTPKDQAPYYSENFVYLPYCYQVNDHTQSISNKDWKKENFGLPENCFLFCSFNHPYKIDPIMFDVWMRILQQVSEGILWLLFGNKIAEENLKREAEARGIKSERLFFAETLPKCEHLLRLRFADLALDTRIVNGHTTTSDALWAGVPLITLKGSHFASRVSSSILSAMWLPELITHSLQEYEALAVKLAHNPAELQEIRQTIARNRSVATLFDTPRFVRNIETAYKEMWEIFLAGKAPQQIEVLER